MSLNVNHLVRRTAERPRIGLTAPSGAAGR
jgi:hypothetical protein